MEPDIAIRSVPSRESIHLARGQDTPASILADLTLTRREKDFVITMRRKFLQGDVSAMEREVTTRGGVRMKIYGTGG